MEIRKPGTKDEEKYLTREDLCTMSPQEVCAFMGVEWIESDVLDRMLIGDMEDRSPRDRLETVSTRVRK